MNTADQQTEAVSEKTLETRTRRQLQASNSVRQRAADRYRMAVAGEIPAEAGPVRISGEKRLYTVSDAMGKFKSQQKRRAKNKAAAASRKRNRR